MKLITKCLAEICLKDENAPIPIFVPVVSLTQTNDSSNFTIDRIIQASSGLNNLSYKGDVYTFLQNTIAGNNCILLFDGIDESGRYFNLIESDILEMSKTNIKGIITSSRMSSFDDLQGFYQFQPTKVLPLTLKMQMEIARKRGFSEFDILKYFNSSHSSELCESPFFLSLVIEVLKTESLSKISTARRYLYSKVTNSMLEKYVSEKTSSMNLPFKIGTDAIEHLLKQIAMNIHDMRSTEISIKTLIKSFKGIEMNVWNLIEEDLKNSNFPLLSTFGSRIKFNHLSFQEYLTACSWANPKIQSPIRMIGNSKNTFELDKNKIEYLIVDPWNREVFLILSSILSTKEFNFLLEILLKLFNSSTIVRSLVSKMISERPPDEQQSLKEYFKKENLFDMLYEGLISESEEMRNMASKEFLLKEKRISFDFANTFSPEKYLPHLSNENLSVRKAALTVLVKYFQIENGGNFPVEFACEQLATAQHDEIFKYLSLVPLSKEKLIQKTKVLDCLIELFQDPSNSFFILPFRMGKLHHKILCNFID
jgi:hypothetical protein